MFFLLCLLYFSNAFERIQFPVMGTVYYDPSGIYRESLTAFISNMYQYKQMTIDETKKSKDEILNEGISEDLYNEYIDFLESYEWYYAGNSSDLDGVGEFSFLGIYVLSANSYENSLDLSYLKENTRVYICEISLIDFFGHEKEYSQRFFRKAFKLIKKSKSRPSDITAKKIVNLAKPKVSSQKAMKAIFTSPLYIKGNDGGKVGFLSLENGYYIFTHSNLRPNLYLFSDAILLPNIIETISIDSEIVVAEEQTSWYSPLGQYAPVKRFFIHSPDQRESYTLSFSESSMNGMLDYSWASEQIGWIGSVAYNITLQLDYPIDHLLPVNLSLQQAFFSYNDLSGNPNQLASVDVILTGSWASMTTKPQIIIEAENPNNVNLPRETHGISFSKNNVYVYEYESGGGGLSAGAIAGIVIACVVVVGVIVGLCVYFFVIRKPKDQSSNKE